MYAGLQIAKAWELLNSGKIGHLDTNAYMELCRAAGYSEAVVQKAGNEWANRRLDAGAKM